VSSYKLSNVGAAYRYRLSERLCRSQARRISSELKNNVLRRTVESPGEYNGVTLTDRTKILERWKEHFETVLNQSSSFDMNVLSEIPQWPLASRLEEVPTRAEIQKAINQMSNGKAPGTDGIPAEVFKKCSSCLLLHLVDLF